MISITINPQTPHHIQVIAKALAAILAGDADQAPAEVTQEAAPAKKPRKGQAESPAPIAPKQEELASGTPPSSEPSAEPTKPLTLEDVRAVLAKLSAEGKPVKNVITELGFTKLTEIPADKYADLLAKAEAL